MKIFHVISHGYSSCGNNGIYCIFIKCPFGYRVCRFLFKTFSHLWLRLLLARANYQWCCRLWYCVEFWWGFVGLTVFIYLGGMMVVFGYTTVMATEKYPET